MENIQNSAGKEHVNKKHKDFSSKASISYNSSTHPTSDVNCIAGRLGKHAGARGESEPILAPTLTLKFPATSEELNKQENHKDSKTSSCLKTDEYRARIQL